MTEPSGLGFGLLPTSPFFLSTTSTLVVVKPIGMAGMKDYSICESWRELT